MPKYKLDEYSELLVKHSVLYDGSTDHPLCGRSISPLRRHRTPPAITVTCSEGNVGPSDRSSIDTVESLITTSETSTKSCNVVKHTVGPDDSIAGVAVRYGVSIAAIRRANQLWPSDPIHFRTELLIPRVNTPRSSYKSVSHGAVDSPLGSTVEPVSSDLPPLSSSLVSLRNMILSLPARMSLESLSSKATTSEDHELDILRATRSESHRASPHTSCSGEGPGAPALRAQRPQPDDSLSSSLAYLTHSDHLQDFSYTSLTSNLHPRPVCSSAVVASVRPLRTQPFATLPVRTAQLEPEPAMELPVRRPRV